MEETLYPKIIVRLPSSISRVIDALPIFSVLRMNFPGSSISALIPERLAPLLRNIDIDHVLKFERWPKFTPLLSGGDDVISHLQKNQYDIGINMSRSFAACYLFYQGMVKKRIGLYHPLGAFLLTDKVEGRDYKDLLGPLDIHDFEWNQRVFGISDKKNRLQIGLQYDCESENITNKWYDDLIDFIIGEIPAVEIVLLAKKKYQNDLVKFLESYESQVSYAFIDEPLEDVIDTIYNLSILVSSDDKRLALSRGVKTPSVDLKTISSNHLFVEDIFFKIKDAMLEPLKDTSSKINFSDFEPIEEGHKAASLSGKSDKKVGVIILAGGMGRRLGFEKPKGFFPIGDEILYDILLKKTKNAERVGILTSPVTYSETFQYVRDKPIDLFTKRVYPTECGNGVSPEGNGALFDAVVYSKYWDQWKKLDIISVIAIDNPLANPMDEELISTDKEIAVIGVDRDKQEEKLGVLCKKGDCLSVREYFTLKKDGMEGLGYSGIFAAKPSFFEKVASKTLPFYRVEKKNQVFFERLLIDGFMYAQSYDVIQKDRSECFFPIKEKKDVFNYCKLQDIGGDK
jgi:hypothetical protein